MKVNKQRRWLLALVIIGVVLIATIAFILANRAPSEKIALKAVSDGSGGAFAAWYQNQGIHVQRMGSGGNLVWTKEVLLEDTQLLQPDHFALAEDGQGGVVVTWGDMSMLGDDSNDPSYFNPVPIYSQRLNANGEPLWGKGVSTGSGEHHGLALTMPQIMLDSAGGVYILGNDFKPAYKALHDDYFRLRKLSPEGKPVWEKLLFSSPTFHSTTPEEKTGGEKGVANRSWPLWTGVVMVSDNQGGAIVVWEEETQQRYANIWAQRYDANGQLAWKEDGVLISSAWDANVQVTSDSSGGAIILIGAGRQTNTDSATYTAQRISSEGKLLWQDAGTVIKEGLQPWGSIEVMTQGMDIILLWQETAGKPEIIDGRPVWQIAVNAERIIFDGTIAWKRFPQFISEAGKSFSDLAISKSNDGVILAWRSGGPEQWGGEVFTQKMNTDDGKLAWIEKGVPVFGTEYQYQGSPLVLPDGAGGAIILAVTGKSPINGDMVYAQRLDAVGSALWGDGIKLSP